MSGEIAWSINLLAINLPHVLQKETTVRGGMTEGEMAEGGREGGERGREEGGGRKGGEGGRKEGREGGLTDSL